ncbi:hypothetical protein MLD38_026777 [Melastoma candidum]|uniref:Uncharacterized protein n=3 Tax=Melastoma candidum TaxID=119954 RepID=A0ACB9P0J8_9MYRT|nr:hypothetical protein MLD38_031400 [Melastoma candidum]KAI4326049.1 hypothetical protein MLD38_031402 [Melastoma candidum]KAI4342120.1 hypothetical protein MLD38_026777 [Melastoma candidum]
MALFSAPLGWVSPRPASGSRLPSLAESLGQVASKSEENRGVARAGSLAAMQMGVPATPLSNWGGIHASMTRWGLAHCRAAVGFEGRLCSVIAIDVGGRAPRGNFISGIDAEGGGIFVEPLVGEGGTVVEAENAEETPWVGDSGMVPGNAARTGPTRTAQMGSRRVVLCQG